MLICLNNKKKTLSSSQNYKLNHTSLMDTIETLEGVDLNKKKTFRKTWVVVPEGLQGFCEK